MLHTKRHCQAALAVLAFITCFASLASASEETTFEIWNGDTVEMMKGRAILTTTSDTGYAAMGSLIEEYFVSIEKLHAELRMYFLSFPDTQDIVTLCESFNADENTAHCSPDFVAYELTEDYYFDLQWSFFNAGQRGGTQGADMMIAEAHAITEGSVNARVGILDSGIPFDDDADTLMHEDLKNSARIALGQICYEGNPQVWNDNQTYGHGTAVAGIALAERNAYGIVGTCPGCSGVIEKIMNNGNPSSTSIINGILDAEERGVQVINLSYRTEPDTHLTGVIYRAGQESGITFTFPCGNDGFDNSSDCFYPASLAAAVDLRSLFAYFFSLISYPSSPPRGLGGS